MKKPIEKIETVSCHRSRDGRRTLEDCKLCKYYGGALDDGKAVDCLWNELPVFANFEIKELIKKDYVYRKRLYDPNIDGKIEGPCKTDYCQKCVFDHTMRNGERVCLLRQIGSDVFKSTTCCYNGEIWYKEKLEENEI